MSVHESTLKGLQEALEYVRGDKSKGRSVFVEVPDDEINFYGLFKKLSANNRKKAMDYMNDLLLEDAV